MAQCFEIYRRARSALWALLLGGAVAATAGAAGSTPGGSAPTGSEPAGQAGKTGTGQAGQAGTGSEDGSPEWAPGELHQPFDRLLRAHVEDGHVDYAGFQREEAALDAYLARLAVTDLRKLSRAGRKALWINAYNAFTIKLILREYPGIRSIKSFWGPWDKRDWLVNGNLRTLNEMEHEILRPMGDPRIHAAIVCASISCPDLAGEAYVEERLDEQLDAAMRRFLAHPEKGFRAATEKGALYGVNHNVYLSKIFSWFAGDFGGSEDEILAYLDPFLPEAGRDFLREHPRDRRVRYFAYDWNLNGE